MGAGNILRNLNLSNRIRGNMLKETRFYHSASAHLVSHILKKKKNRD